MSDESTTNRYGFLNQKSQTRSPAEILLGVDSAYVYGICQRLEGYQQKIEKLERTPLTISSAGHNVGAVLVLKTCVAKLNAQVPEDVHHPRPSSQ